MQRLSLFVVLVCLVLMPSLGLGNDSDVSEEPCPGAFNGQETEESELPRGPAVFEDILTQTKPDGTIFHARLRSGVMIASTGAMIYAVSFFFGADTMTGIALGSAVGSTLHSFFQGMFHPWRSLLDSFLKQHFGYGRNPFSNQVLPPGAQIETTQMFWLLGHVVGDIPWTIRGNMEGLISIINARLPALQAALNEGDIEFAAKSIALVILSSVVMYPDLTAAPTYVELALRNIIYLGENRIGIDELRTQTISTLQQEQHKLFRGKSLSNLQKQGVQNLIKAIFEQTQ